MSIDIRDVLQIQKLRGMNVAVKKMKNTFVGEEADEQKYIFDYYLKMSLSTIDGDFLYEKPLWED